MEGRHPPDLAFGAMLLFLVLTGHQYFFADVDLSRLLRFCTAFSAHVAVSFPPGPLELGGIGAAECDWPR